MYVVYSYTIQLRYFVIAAQANQYIVFLTY